MLVVSSLSRRISSNHQRPFFDTSFVSSSGRTQVRQSLINPDWDFNKMGIGGLDKEFNAIFRRAFASRVFPPEIIEQLGTSLCVRSSPSATQSSV